MPLSAANKNITHPHPSCRIPSGGRDDAGTYRAPGGGDIEGDHSRSLHGGEDEEDEEGGCA